MYYLLYKRQYMREVINSYWVLPSNSYVLTSTQFTLTNILCGYKSDYQLSTDELPLVGHYKYKGKYGDSDG